MQVKECSNILRNVSLILQPTGEKHKAEKRRSSSEDDGDPDGRDGGEGAENKKKMDIDRE